MVIQMMRIMIFRDIDHNSGHGLLQYCELFPESPLGFITGGQTIKVSIPGIIPQKGIKESLN